MGNRVEMLHKSSLLGLSHLLSDHFESAWERIIDLFSACAADIQELSASIASFAHEGDGKAGKSQTAAASP